MMNCAYCDRSCQQTREHVIPRWYIEQVEDLTTFSSRAPLTHLKGDLIVRDVCADCNGNVLAKLDAYGKELYERYFGSILYLGEHVTFQYDGDRLLRWLLKLSYNSARAQNADSTVLRNYREVMLGKAPLPNRIRCWFHLVSATCIDQDANVLRPAWRHQQSTHHITEPRWFRIVQFRLENFSTISLVQRMVIINSFAFTIVVARSNDPLPCAELDAWVREYEQKYPEAQPIFQGANRATATATGDHALASIYPTTQHYPTRFSRENNPNIVKGIKNELEAVMIWILREEVEAGETAILIDALKNMVSTRERAIAFRQRIAISVEGYDTDTRELWEIPEARDFFRQVFAECPFVMMLSHPEGGLLRLLFACWIFENNQEDSGRIRDFLEKAFHGLNSLNHTIMLSEEQNGEITRSSLKVLFGETFSNEGDENRIVT